MMNRFHPVPSAFHSAQVPDPGSALWGSRWTSAADPLSRRRGRRRDLDLPGPGAPFNSFPVRAPVGLGWVSLEGPVIPSEEVRLEP